MRDRRFVWTGGVSGRKDTGKSSGGDELLFFNDPFSGGDVGARFVDIESELEEEEKDEKEETPFINGARLFPLKKRGG
jgi:hypothetical protein